MSKIICEICGTSYQDSADCCPICGCARGSAAELLGDEVTMEETAVQPKAKTAPSKKQIFDYDEANTFQDQDEPDPVEEAPEFDDEEDDGEDGRGHNTLVVILLTVLIAALLIAAGFIFVRYFLPNLGGDEETVPETSLAQMEDSLDSTDLRIPCETLILNSTAKAELTEVGFSHLINVMPSPKETTDELTFVSADESIATVTEDGKITAVGEGETIVTIKCGDVQMFVNVICDFTPETEPATEATGETVDATAETVDPTAETVEDSEGETKAEGEDSTEPEEGEETKKEVDPSIKLKLKKTDISLGAYYSFRLELDCDLDPKDVEWSSEHPYVATVDEEGVVTAIMKGVTTDIIVRYGDQEVRCKVRVV